MGEREHEGTGLSRARLPTCRPALPPHLIGQNKSHDQPHSREAGGRPCFSLGALAESEGVRLGRGGVEKWGHLCNQPRGF